MDPNNTQSGQNPPLGSNNFSASNPPPSVDVNSMPPLDQTPTPGPTMPSPPVEPPVSIPTMSATLPENPKKPFPMAMVALLVLAAVVIVVLGYVAYTRLSGSDADKEIMTNDQPIEQTVEDVPLEDGVMSADYPEGSDGTVPSEDTGDAGTLDVPTDSPTTPTDPPAEITTP